MILYMHTIYVYFDLLSKQHQDRQLWALYTSDFMINIEDWVRTLPYYQKHIHFAFDVYFQCSLS